MTNKVKIAVDAMGGEHSPKKIIDGIEASLNFNKNNHFYLFGEKNIIEKSLDEKKDLYNFCEIIHTKDKILMTKAHLLQPRGEKF